MSLDREALRVQLQSDEGLRLFPYLDTENVWTVGYGHNLTVRGISRAVAQLLLEDDITLTLNSLASVPWFAELSDVRQQVVANMVFNMGLTAVLAFHDMITALRQQDWDAAADAMLDSRWAVQVGPRAYRLATMMRTDGAP